MPEPTSFLAVEDLDAVETLAAAESVVRDRRAVEVRELEVALRWADLHADDPRVEGQPVVPGTTRLVQLGGAGTPRVQDLSICELAIARGQHTLTTRSFLADALDLRHRLPEFYAAVREGRCDLWVARRVASMTRRLDREAAGLVDRAVTAAVDQGPGRLLGIAEAKVIEADTEAARAEREAAEAPPLRRRDADRRVRPADRDRPGGARRRRMAGCHRRPGRRRPGRTPRPGPRAARRLHPRRLRSVALGWLAHPEDVVALLAGDAEPRGHAAKAHRAVVHVHLHQAALAGAAGVARVEEVGPLLVDELTQLLGHAEHPRAGHRPPPR